MHPYRDSAMPAKQPRRPHPEELVLYALLAGIGIIPVAVALITRERFGLDATLGLLMVGIGLAGAIVCTWRSRRRRSGRRVDSAQPPSDAGAGSRNL
jgi:hypothetical protein